MIGQRVRRREDPRFITGHGNYVDDMTFTDALHCVFVRSEYAHGTLSPIDTSAAAELDGVQVFTAADIDMDLFPPQFPGPPEAMMRPFVASDRVRFVGEIIAVVLAETRAAAVDAAELIWPEVDSLPVVTDMRESIKDETLLFDDHGTNLALADGPEEVPEGFFDDCEVVVEGQIHSQRIHVTPIEPRATAALWEDGRLNIWISTQTPHQDKSRLAGPLGVEESDIRVLAPDVGGGFGGKGLMVEDVLIAWMSRKAGRPVRWVETRSEHMVAMGHGRGQRIAFQLGGDRDGTFKAVYLKLLQDAGAYPSAGAVIPNFTKLMSTGVYKIPRIEVRFDSVLTNTTPTAALRGAGRPEATQGLERAAEVFAAEIGMDPAEVRRRNFIQPDDFPYATPSGLSYDVGDYEMVLDKALETAGYDQLRAEQQRRRDAGDATLLGIGMGVYVEITNPIGEKEFGSAEITPDGHAIVKTGSFSHGQGHETAWAQIASAQLGIPVESITVLKGDTDQIPFGTGTYGSKSLQIGGAAARQAAVELVDKAKELAAEQLEANPDDMVFELESGEFHVAGAPSPSLDWEQLASALESAGRLPELAVETSFQAAQPTFPFGAHIVVVEVDTETGTVHLDRVVCVDDAGTIVNPNLADGQIHGGVACGLAQALFEENAFDEDGNPQNANFVTYCIPSAMEFPQFELVRTQTPTPVNPLGAKGIGESGTIGSTPAAINAVIDALSHLGVRDIEMPANGERVWQAIQDAAQ